MTLVFKFNKERTRFWSVGYLTKGEAAEITSVMPAELLDLDPLYGGMHIFTIISLFQIICCSLHLIDMDQT